MILKTHTERRRGRQCPVVPPGAKPYTCEWTLSGSCAITYSPLMITHYPTVRVTEDTPEEEEGKRPEVRKEEKKGRVEEKITGQ